MAATAFSVLPGMAPILLVSGIGSRMQSVDAFPEEDCMRSRSFDIRSLRSVLKTLVTLAVIHALVAEAPAHADAVADFYKGKDIRFIISTSSGTGYDTYARTVARHLPRHL